MHELKECKIHGLTKYRFEKDIKYGKDYGRYRCSKCRQKSRNRTRRKNRKILIQEAGGKCIRCDYKRSEEALHFHHINPEIKSFTISNTGYSLSRCRKEAKKCILLCANCHIEEHAKALNRSS